MEIFRNMKDNEMIGNVYSKDWAMKHVLKMNDEEIQMQKAEIEQEKETEPEQSQGDDQGGF